MDAVRGEMAFAQSLEAAPSIAISFPQLKCDARSCPYPACPACYSGWHAWKHSPFVQVRASLAGQSPTGIRARIAEFRRDCAASSLPSAAVSTMPSAPPLPNVPVQRLSAVQSALRARLPRICSSRKTICGKCTDGSVSPRRACARSRPSRANVAPAGFQPPADPVQAPPPEPRQRIRRSRH